MLLGFRLQTDVSCENKNKPILSQKLKSQTQNLFLVSRGLICPPSDLLQKSQHIVFNMFFYGLYESYALLFEDCFNSSQHKNVWCLVEHMVLGFFFFLNYLALLQDQHGVVLGAVILRMVFNQFLFL